MLRRKALSIVHGDRRGALIRFAERVNPQVSPCARPASACSPGSPADHGTVDGAQLTELATNRGRKRDGVGVTGVVRVVVVKVPFCGDDLY